MNPNPGYFSTCLLGLLLLYVIPANSETEPAAGNQAPAFRLPDQLGMLHTLADYSGSWLVLYFYPRDNTPGCTIEAGNFRDDISGIRALGAEVVGVSLDSIESHREFAEMHRLPFTLLSDSNGEVAASYGALMAMGPVSFARRHTFIIDDQGRIARVFRRIDPRVHSKVVLETLEELLSP